MKTSRKLLITTMLCITLFVGMMSGYGLQAGAATENATGNRRVAVGTAHALLIDNAGNVMYGQWATTTTNSWETVLPKHGGNR